MAYFSHDKLNQKQESKRMRKNIFLMLVAMLLVLTSCSNINSVLKAPSFSYKYEVAKQYYAEGYYNKAAMVLANVVTSLKGTEKGEESLFLLGMASMKAKDYDAASTYFKKYYQSYPKGEYTEEARYQSGMALYMSTPEPKLDQSATYEAVTEFQNFIDVYPTSTRRVDAQNRIFELQDKLVEKEYLNAKLYFDLGSYIGNGTNGNYEACIVTAENAIKDFPYTKRREDFSYLIVKAKFEYAKKSVASKQEERYGNAIDEYYGFQSEYPESKYKKDVEKMYSEVPNAFKRAEN